MAVSRASYETNHALSIWNIGAVIYVEVKDLTNGWPIFKLQKLNSMIRAQEY